MVTGVVESLVTKNLEHQAKVEEKGTKEWIRIPGSHGRTWAAYSWQIIESAQTSVPCPERKMWSSEQTGKRAPLLAGWGGLLSSKNFLEQPSCPKEVAPGRWSTRYLPAGYEFHWVPWNSNAQEGTVYPKPPPTCKSSALDGPMGKLKTCVVYVVLQSPSKSSLPHRLKRHHLTSSIYLQPNQ